jgi:hypothetical protein
MRIVLFFLFFFVTSLTAQEILPVMNNPMEEIYRRKQLLGDSMFQQNQLSFTVRPISLSDTVNRNKFNFTLLPFQYIQQFNSHRSLNYADGSMIPTKGWQFNYSLGFQASYKGFTAIIRPEYNWAVNLPAPGFSTDHFPILWKYYYEWLNKIDVPEFSEDKPIRKVYGGQSRIQYSYKGVALGVSTENLWWGPGRFNSLLMSNNAPGFLHFTFHSDKPLQTKIGNFEWQAITGTLRPSNQLPPETMRSYGGRFLHVPKNTYGDRIITGGVLTWQPKWFKGLYLGFDGVGYRYKNSAGNYAKMGSLFFRYVIPKENLELYFQYGRYDKLATPINIFGDTIPRGYLGGLRKLFPLSGSNKNDRFLQVGLEITQLQAPNPYLINRAESWYNHGTVRHGYTHEGQIVGAPIGSGSNTQRIEVSYIKGNNRIGIELDRWLHNTDFYYRYNTNSGSFDYNRHWVDLMASLVWNVQIKKVMLFGQLSAVRAINYQWKAYIPESGQVSNYFDNGWDFMNYHGRIGLQYNINR